AAAGLHLVDVAGAGSGAGSSLRGDRGAAPDAGAVRAGRATTFPAGSLSRLPRPKPRLRRHLLAELRLGRAGSRGLGRGGRIRPLSREATARLREGAGPRARGAPRTVP